MTATECVNPEYVILVDENDQEIGQAEKISAHEKNLLHRAFSIFIFRTHQGQAQVLLQQRALTKYHSPGLWTNTCCSHPRPNEAILTAGTRRLKEEFGFSTELKNVGWFHYNAHFSNGLSENEIDHVLVGSLNDEKQIKPNPAEIHTYRWVAIDELQQELAANPEQFTPWFAQALHLAEQHC